MRRHLSYALLPCAALLGTCVLAGLPARVDAADRALLVGVGKYADSRNNLPGIDLDIEQMRTLAQALGFTEIATVTDQQATLDQVVAKIQSWLIQGTTASDRVLLYFSGHGSRIPDESGDEADDGADEALTMHDLRAARRNGRDTLDGVLVDDQLAALLAQIPSRKVLVLVDACHSGTADKGLQRAATRSLAAQGGVSKAYWYQGMPAAMATKGLTRSAASGNYVMIAAAQDDEASIATRDGSLFTLAIVKAFGTGAPDRLTPEELARQATTGVEGKFHPQLQGNPVLAAAPIAQRPGADTGGEAPPADGGPAWREIQAAASRMAPLTVRTNANKYAPNTLMEITVEVPKAGYLNVLYVDERDQPTVIFPNALRTGNSVAAGTLHIPDATMNFDLPASGAGRNLIVAIWSATSTNLFAESAKGTAGIFRTLTTKEASDYARAFNPRQRVETDPPLRAGQQVVEVCEGC